MANTFVKHPVNNSDENVWGPKNTAVLESVTGICTAFLYLSAGTMYISTGKIGIVDTPSGTNGIGVVNISAAESIAHAGTNGIWKRVYMTVSGSTASFAIADMAGETSADVLPDTLFNAYVPAKGGYYVNNNARDIGAVWVDAGGNALYVITDKTTVNSASVIYAKDGSGLLLTDDGGNLGLCVEDGGNVGIKTRDPSAAFSVNGSINLPAATTEYRAITLGSGRSGNASTDINFISDATYTTYGLRIHRDNTGANSVSQILHRGTGALSLFTNEAANITFLTANTNRFTISGSGDEAGFAGYAGGANRDCYLYFATDAYFWWDESGTQLKMYFATAAVAFFSDGFLKMGGGADGADRDVTFNVASDTYFMWDEAPGQFVFNIASTDEVYIKTDHITFAGSADSYIDMAGDAAMMWDESEDEFYFNKSIKVDNGIETDGTKLKTKIVTMGDWNMDSTASINVAHGVTLANLRSVTAMIRDDANTTYYPSNWPNAVGTEIDYWVDYIDGTNIKMSRRSSGTFDSVTFDSTSYNRGWLTITYAV